MSRQFVRNVFSLGDSDYVTFGAGGLSGVDGGPITVALLFRADGLTGDRDLMAAVSAGGSVLWGVNQSGGQIFVACGGGFIGGASISTGTWYLYLWTKPAGSSQVRDHLCDMSTGVWTHANRGVLGDSAGPVDHLWLGRVYGSYLDGYIGAAGVGATEYTDADCEALQFGLRPWITADATEPARAALDAVWRGNDTPMDDLSTAAADQSAIQGTSVNTGVEPPSFDYDTSVIVPEPEPEPEVPITGGGWQSYLAILKDNQREYAQYREQELYHPVACPNDGEPLSKGPDGRPYCAYDGWRPDLVSS